LSQGATKELPIGWVAPGNSSPGALRPRGLVPVLQMQLMSLATILGMATATIDVIKKSLVGCLTDHGHQKKGW